MVLTLEYKSFYPVNFLSVFPGNALFFFLPTQQSLFHLPVFRRLVLNYTPPLDPQEKPEVSDDLF